LSDLDFPETGLLFTKSSSLNAGFRFLSFLKITCSIDAQAFSLSSNIAKLARALLAAAACAKTRLAQPWYGLWLACSLEIE
jgi:hypothetical protein